ncbi:hypothetical protein BH11BAC3_BH11BAC3_08480 [soil metagenome]
MVLSLLYRTVRKKVSLTISHSPFTFFQTNSYLPRLTTVPLVSVKPPVPSSASISLLPHNPVVVNDEPVMPALMVLPMAFTISALPIVDGPPLLNSSASSVYELPSAIESPLFNAFSKARIKKAICFSTLIGSNAVSDCAETMPEKK